MVTDDRDNQGHELDAQGCEEEDVVNDGVGRAGRGAELVRAARERGEDLTGPDGLLKSITATVLESALEEEMTDHLGHDKHQAPEGGAGNIRNGTRGKTVLTDAAGDVEHRRCRGTGRARSSR